MQSFFQNKKHQNIARCCLVTAIICVVVVLAVFHVAEIRKGLSYLLGILSPILAAAVTAYFVTPLVRFFEKKLFSKIKGISDGLSTLLSTSIVFLIIVGSLVLFVVVMIPLIRDSYRELEANADGYLKTLNTYADRLMTRFPSLEDDYASIAELLQTESVSELLAGIVDRYFDFLKLAGSYAVKYAEIIVVGAYRVVGVLVLAFWMVLARHKLASGARRLSNTVFGEERSGAVCRFVSYTDRMFGGFFSGKVLDSAIIGVLTFAVLAVFGIPYNPLLSVVVGVTNMIPYFGPLIGIVFGALVLLIPAPGKAFLFVILGILIQQLDGNVIGPYILGDSIGLRSIWVMISITIFGELFGVWGMFLGAPAFAVLLEIGRRLVNWNMERKTRKANSSAGKEDVPC